MVTNVLRNEHILISQVKISLIEKTLWLRTYLVCIGVTAWVVLKPESNLAWRMFGSMPRPSSQLAELLHYPDARGYNT